MSRSATVLVLLFAVCLCYPVLASENSEPAQIHPNTAITEIAAGSPAPGIPSSPVLQENRPTKKRGYRSELDIPISVLICHAHTPVPTALMGELRAFEDIETVDAFLMTNATPSAEDIEDYDVVMTYSDNTYQNATTFGNIIADFVDDGGGFVPCMFSFATGGLSLAGRIVQDDYLPFQVGRTYAFNLRGLGDYDE